MCDERDTAVVELLAGRVDASALNALDSRRDAHHASQSQNVAREEILLVDAWAKVYPKVNEMLSELSDGSGDGDVMAQVRNQLIDFLRDKSQSAMTDAGNALANAASAPSQPPLSAEDKELYGEEFETEDSPPADDVEAEP